MNHTLGYAGGARGVHDEERVVKGQLFEAEGWDHALRGAPGGQEPLYQTPTYDNKIWDL